MARPVLDLALLASLVLLLVWKFHAPGDQRAPVCVSCVATPQPAAAPATPAEMLAPATAASEGPLKPCCQIPTRAALNPLGAPAAR